MSEEQPKVAWKVEVNGYSCIVFATTKPKARWIAVRSYWEAYSRNQGWPSVSAWRVPRYDDSARKSDPPRAFCEEFV